MFDYSLNNIKEGACVALPMINQGIRETGPFFGLHGHLAAIGVSVLGKVVDQALCLEHCADCTWIAGLSPNEIGIEVIKGLVSLSENPVLGKIKKLTGGSEGLLKATQDAYVGGQLLLGFAEYSSRQGHILSCCKGKPENNKENEKQNHGDNEEMMNQNHLNYTSTRIGIASRPTTGFNSNDLESKAISGKEQERIEVNAKTERIC